MTVVRNVGPGEAYQMSVGKEQRNGMDTMLCIVYNDLRNGMCVDSPTRRSYNEQQCEGRCYATSKERESDAKKKRDCRDNENGSPESHRRARRGGTDYSEASVEEVIFVIAFSDAARDTGMRQLEQILAELAWEDGQ